MSTTPAVKLPGHISLDSTYVDLARADSQNPSLMTRLRAYDANLIVFYHRNLNRWVVARRGRDLEARLVMVWQDENGGFLSLDDRLLHALAQADLWRTPGDADAEARRRDAEDDARAERVDRAFDDDISHLTRANRRFLMKQAARTLNI